MVTVTENKITIIDDITFETVAGGEHYYLGQYLEDFKASVSRIMRDTNGRYCLELIGRGLDVFVVYVDAEGKFIEDDDHATSDIPPTMHIDDEEWERENGRYPLDGLPSTK